MRKLFIIIFLILALDKPSYAANAWVDNKAVCEAGRGNWRLFGNSCADNCQAQVDILVCTIDSLFACDCGEKRCWNGDKCVSVKSYKVLFDQAREEKRKEEEAAKKSDMEEKVKENKEMQDKINQVQDQALEVFNQQKAINQVEPAKPAETQQLTLDKTLDKIIPDGIDPKTKVQDILNQAQDSTKKTLCEQNGGSWQQFSNGCVDNCSNKIAQFSMCTTVLTFGCKCGEGKCWDSSNNKCSTIDNYKDTIVKLNNTAQQNNTLQNNQNNQKLPDDSQSDFGKSLDFLTK